MMIYKHFNILVFSLLKSALGIQNCIKHSSLVYFAILIQKTTKFNYQNRTQFYAKKTFFG